MQIEHDTEADAIYITLSEGVYAYGEDLDPERRVDYDAEGHAVGIELLNVSAGVELDNLPEQAKVAKLLAERQIPVFA
ncbi:MAG: DUF2283 domain-containing protein [Candidatus Dormiibacterota bacterium]